MSSVIHTDVVNQPEPDPRHRDQANLALQKVLDAEIASMSDCLRLRSAKAEAARGLARADLERQVVWLQDSLVKLQARRRALS